MTVTMRLREYLDEARGRQAALAKAIDAHAPDISRWADGLRPIPVQYGAKIEIATNGAVTRQDLFPDDWQSIWPELDDTKRNRRRTDKAQ